MENSKDSRAPSPGTNKVIANYSECNLGLILEVEKALADIETGRVTDAKNALQKIKGSRAA